MAVHFPPLLGPSSTHLQPWLPSCKETPAQALSHRSHKATFRQPATPPPEHSLGGASLQRNSRLRPPNHSSDRESHLPSILANSLTVSYTIKSTSPCAQQQPSNRTPVRTNGSPSPSLAAPAWASTPAPATPTPARPPSAAARDSSLRRLTPAQHVTRRTSMMATRRGWY
jgi:hypothetical protein